MNESIIEIFEVGNGVPTERLQRALGNEIEIDVIARTLYVPTKNGIKTAWQGDAIICYIDGSFEVRKGGNR